MTFKRGDKVVVIGSDKDLRLFNCHHSVIEGSVHVVLDASGSDYFLDVPSAPYIRGRWLEAYEDYADEDWV